MSQTSSPVSAFRAKTWSSMLVSMNQLAVDGEVAVGFDQGADHVVAEVVRAIAPVLPDEVAGHRVDRLDDVAGVRHEQHAVADQRRPLLPARAERARPDHPQLTDVVAVDLVERAVAPAVERPAPHQPLVVARILELRVGDGADSVRFLREGGGPGRNRQGGGDDGARRQRRAERERLRAGCEHDPLLHSGSVRTTSSLREARQ